MGRRGNKKKANNNNKHNNFADNKGAGGNNQKKPYKKNDKQQGSHKRRGKGSRDDPREMKFQLEKIGLALKEINGDGNCLFRALADQLYGDSGDRYHMDLRSNTVDFIRRNREDFEPFFAVGEDGASFDRHLENLAEDGTFAGNDAIVAFARRYEVVVVIHQLNEPLWKVGEPGTVDRETTNAKKRGRQLHISYHNGDHYNSVRKIGDLTSNGKAANVFVESAAQENGSAAAADRDSYYGYGSSESDDEGDDNEEDCPYGGASGGYGRLDPSSGHPDKATLRRLIEEVKHRTGSEDYSRIYDALRVNGYEVEAAVTDHKHTMAVEAAARARSALWRDGGTGQRIIGGGIGEGPTNQSSSKKKNTKRRSKRQQNDSPDEDIVATNLATLSI